MKLRCMGGCLPSSKEARDIRILLTIGRALRAECLKFKKQIEWMIFYEMVTVQGEREETHVS